MSRPLRPASPRGEMTLTGDPTMHRTPCLAVAALLVALAMMPGAGVAGQSSVAILKSGTAFVPLRSVSQWLGAEVEYQSGRIVVKRKADRLELRKGSREALKNGKPMRLAQPVAMIDNATYVPLRFMAEGLGATVDYDAKGAKVTIRDGKREMRLDVISERGESTDRQVRLTKVFIYPERGDVFVVHGDGKKAQLTSGGGCQEAKIGPDKQTVGWLHGADIWNDGWSCNIWVVDGLTLMRNGRVVAEVKTDQGMIWDWRFHGSADEVALAVGSAKRGVQYYQLVSASGNRVLDQCQSDYFDAAHGVPKPRWTAGLSK